jgi:hypothetical protein
MAKSTEKTDWKEKIIRAGYRALAKEAHPDGGGSDQEFDALATAHSELWELIKSGAVANGAMDLANKGVNLQLEIVHISALLAGQPVVWTSPNGFQVHLTLRGGTQGLITDVITNLLGTKFGKAKKGR